MLLSIDPQKVQLKLAEKPPSYVVTPYYWEADVIQPEAPTSGFSSFTPSVPPELERARERVLALRQQLIAKGNPFVPDNELERQR